LSLVLLTLGMIVQGTAYNVPMVWPARYNLALHNSTIERQLYCTTMLWMTAITMV